jgi:hypothetical protein
LSRRASRVRGDCALDRLDPPHPDPLPAGERERAESAARSADSIRVGFALGRTEHFTEVILGGAAEPGTIVEATMAGHDGRRLRAG